jgi:carbamoyltransferase
MRLLSINFSHNSSFCTYCDGKVENFFLTERFTKIKYDSDIKSILYIFFNLNLKIDYIVISYCSLINADEKKEKIKLSNFFKSFFKSYKKKYKNIPKILFNFDHHTSHAYLSFHNSGFDESLVMVVDGHGGYVNDNLTEVESLYKFNSSEHELLYKNCIPNPYPYEFLWVKENKYRHEKYDCKNTISIGILYDIAAILTGNSMFDCGKAMGLSSYGKENKEFKNLFLNKNTFNNNFFKQSSENIRSFLTKPVEKITKENYKLHADFCYEVQKQTQEAVGDLIEDGIKKTGIKKVCICGGYGMNIVANHYYLQRFPDVDFYFEPLCGDSGISIGVAIYEYLKLNNNSKHIPQKTTSFNGFLYDISSYNGKTTSIKNVAQILFEDKSIAVYTGLAEAGQRALGNRSILFNALNSDAKDLVNKIKKREWYRPFAAMVLEEDANTYFDMGRIKSSPFMTICFPVRPKYVKIIPGVTHVDNTCRIQTVSQSNGYLYKLLQEFKKLSGHGILLNTSFNLAGEPLVETPEDAFNTLKNSCLDYLWFEETQQLISNTNHKFMFNYV